MSAGTRVPRTQLGQNASVRSKDFKFKQAGPGALCMLCCRGHDAAEDQLFQRLRVLEQKACVPWCLLFVPRLALQRGPPSLPQEAHALPVPAAAATAALTARDTAEQLDDGARSDEADEIEEVEENLDAEELRIAASATSKAVSPFWAVPLKSGWCGSFKGRLQLGLGGLHVAGSH